MAVDRLIQRTLATLRDLRDEAVDFAEEHSRDVDVVDSRYANSARNLLHYLSIRQTDIRDLQQDLHSLGLSSLGVLEAHALATLNAVIGNLEVLANVPASVPRRHRSISGPADSCFTTTHVACWVPSPRPLGAHHGDDAQRRGRRSAPDRRPAARGDGPDAHQLRTRRRHGLAKNGEQPAAGRAARRPQVRDPGGPGRAEASHRQHRAGRAFRSHQAEARCGRSPHGAGTGLADAR
jgi:hypothetical protein